jgi:hypothetical protein
MIVAILRERQVPGVSERCGEAPFAAVAQLDLDQLRRVPGGATDTTRPMISASSGTIVKRA